MPLSGNDDVALLNDVANDAESLEKSNLTSLLKIIPGSRLLLSSSPGLVLRTHVGSPGKVSKGAKIRNRYN